MDQLKTLLRQLVKHRFWIVVAVAAILPLGLYFGLSGSLNADTDKKKNDILAAKKEVDGYTSGTIPNSQHLEIVAEKTAVLKGEVDKTWKTLYDRQAPLMVWPETVQDKFPVWGRTWPKDVDNNLVQEAINEFVNAFPAEVDRVYASFKPFDFTEGTGIVTAPPKAELLRAPEFDYKKQPTLKEIWDAQQRLWLQSSLLDVVAKVNKDADDWDSATIKQVTLLDVASITAQDQPSATSKDSKLAKSAEIVSADAPPPPSTTGGGGGGGSAPGGSADMMSRMGSMSTMMGGTAAPTADVYMVEAPGGQYTLFPVSIGVLMEQSKIQEFLAALQNSPMVIQVKELDIQRPTSRVQKPSKNAQNDFANMAGMGGRFGMGGRGPTVFNPQIMSSMGAGSYMDQMSRNRMSGPPAGSMTAPYGTMRGMAGMRNQPVKEVRKGVDVRDRKAAEKEKKAAEVAKAEADAAAGKAEPALPYYDIVQVTIYGEARFYTKPPEPEPSASDSAKADAPKADAADAAPDRAKAEDAATPKADAQEGGKVDKAEPADDKPAADDKAMDDKAETPKADAPKIDDDAPDAKPKAPADAPKATAEPSRK